MESDLWKGFVRSEKGAFSRMYDLHVDSLFSYGCKLCSDSEMVKDSIQDVFIDLYEHRNQLSVPNNIKFYLFKALKRTLFRRLKKERKFGSINERNDLSFQTDYSIEKETINVEIENYKKKLILHTLKTLTRKQQEILYLKFTMGFDYQEISQILGIDNNSVRKQVYRAIKRLRESQLIKELKTIVLFKLFGARVAIS